MSLARACRDHLIHGTTTAFAEGLADAQEDLLTLADRATKLELQQLYLIAQRLLSARGQELLQQFRTRFIESFDSELRALSHPTPPEGATPSTTELGLVDCDDFERDLGIAKLASRAAYNCSQQLTALERRLAALLSVARIRQEENPLHPRALFTAFLKAVQAMDVDRELDLVLLQQFEQRTAAKLPGIYAVINRHLVDNGVLPTIPVGTDEPAARGEPQPDTTPYQGRPAASDGGSGARAVTAGASAGRVPATIPPLAAAQGAEFGQPPAEDIFARLLASLQALGMSTPLTLPAGQPETRGQLLGALTRLQRGADQSLGPLGLDGTQLAADSVGFLQQMRATPMDGWSQPIDVLTLDILAMLFDLIFDDPDVPSPLHAEIAKLQIPMLKVALIDKGFFSNKRHPARRLLETIARSASAASPEAVPRLLAAVREAVDRIVRDFHADIDIFAVEAEKLAQSLADEWRGSRPELRAVGDAERAIAPEAAEAAVNEQIARRMAEPSLPDLIVGFLDRLWRLVLIQILRESGKKDRAWDQAIATMDELVWSVMPKATEAERQRLLASLPSLLERLHHGVVAVEKGEEWSEFYSGLMDYHMQALRGPLCTAARAGQLQPSPALASPSASVPEDPLGHAEPDRPRDEASQDSHLKLARSLGLGTWVEFRSDRGSRKTLRLSWINAVRSIYLFTNREGKNGLTIAVPRLADSFRRGTARILSEEPLSERSLARMVEKTRGETLRSPAVESPLDR